MAATEPKSKFFGVCYYEGEYLPDTEEKWCHVHLLDASIVLDSSQERIEVPYKSLSKAFQYKWKNLGSTVRIEFENRIISMACRRSNFRGWILGGDNQETLLLFQQLRRKMREDRALNQQPPQHSD